ncbi:hypothetical protein TEA_007660 [Camellia sinensis var. sinensis]|uniref:Uncharacterized protein n=1 Tax=Camellia sinensis var. sinensis TaxID=542762 RepID=A0A4S4D9Z6_CAMSN|nr:hypothetical protein TEA_007660 [Camellia sinensis var. sinensis]
MTQERQELDALQEKIKEHFEVDPKQSLTVTKLPEKINDLVSKTLEDDKATLIDDMNTLTNKLREMEEKFNRLQHLNQNVESQNNNLQTHFIEAYYSPDHLSEKLKGAKPKEEHEHTESIQKEQEEESSIEVKTQEFKLQENMPRPKDGSINSRELKVAVGDDKNGQVGYIDSGELKVAMGDDKSGQDIKKKLGDVENKNRDSLFETTVQLRDVRSAIAKRDEEIHSLQQKLKLLQENFDENKDLKGNNQSISIMLDGQNAKPEATENKVNGALEVPLIKKEEEEDVELILKNLKILEILICDYRSISPIEKKLRTNIDALLDENLDFWLRFSTSFHQIQKFKTGFQDLQAKISKIKEKEKSSQEGSVNATTNIKSDLRPIYKHLREIQTELTLWIEQSTSLKDELQRKFSSLCNIQEEITNALTKGAEEEEMLFTSHDAAEFQGEVVNMKQEHNKVRDELQTVQDVPGSLQSNRMVSIGVDSVSHLPSNTCITNDRATHIEINEECHTSACSREISSNHRLDENRVCREQVDEIERWLRDMSMYPSP